VIVFDSFTLRRAADSYQIFTVQYLIRYSQFCNSDGTGSPLAMFQKAVGGSPVADLSLKRPFAFPESCKIPRILLIGLKTNFFTKLLP
jgi:hypothetical protein